MAPTVSIIVNCFNQACYLERSVKSVLGQTFTDLECIIVDDGSTDNTHQVAQQLMTTDSRVQYYYKENGGLPAARNFGVQQAQGEWVQCLDADDWIHEDKTRFQLSFLSGYENENIIFYSDYERVFLDSNENIIDRQENIIGTLNTQEFIQRLLIPDFLATSPHPALQQCMLMKKSIFNQKKFPEHLKALGDRYFAVDILADGVKFIYTPIIGGFYTKHQSNRTNSWKYMKDYYILFYETVLKEHQYMQEMLGIGIDFILDEAIREKDKETFERLLKIAPIPAHVLNRKLAVPTKSLLRAAYFTRLIIPSFLLYEKHRGPRSKAVLSLFSKLLRRSE